MDKVLRENLVISSLSLAGQQSVARDLVPVNLRLPMLLNPPGSTPDVYFPLSAVISVMTQTGDGQSVENAVIGYDGLFALPNLPNVRGTVQGSGEAFRMSRAAYERHMANEEFRETVDRYHNQLMAFSCQAAVCQAFHTAEQRLAFWLLAMRDRTMDDAMALTQEFLASMLGVQRPTVTIAARILQAAGLIHYRYGRVTITDREGIREAACECYEHSAALLGGGLRNPAVVPEGSNEPAS